MALMPVMKKKLDQKKFQRIFQELNLKMSRLSNNTNTPARTINPPMRILIVESCFMILFYVFVERKSMVGTVSLSLWVIGF